MLFVLNWVLLSCVCVCVCARARVCVYINVCMMRESCALLLGHSPVRSIPLPVSLCIPVLCVPVCPYVFLCCVLLCVPVCSSAVCSCVSLFGVFPFSVSEAKAGERGRGGHVHIQDGKYTYRIRGHLKLGMYACMYVCRYVSMYARMYACTYVRTYGSKHVCMHACVYVCMQTDG